MIPRTKHVLLMLTCLLHLQPSLQFASWFVERQSACWVALRDTTEVVMNNLIVAHDQSSHPSVSIDLYDQEDDTKPIITESVTVTVTDGSGSDSSPILVVYIPDFTADHQASDFGNEQIWTREFTAKLNLNGADLHDVQYVMDIKVSPELDDDVLQQLTGQEARIQARFISSSKGCNDYRAHGRANAKDAGVKFQLVVPSSVFKLSNAADNSVDLVAGWATGHEAVTLTQSIVFRTRPKGKDASTEQESVPNKDTGEHVQEDERVQKNVRKQVQMSIMQQSEELEEAPLAEDTPNDFQLQPEQENVARQEIYDAELITEMAKERNELISITSTSATNNKKTATQKRAKKHKQRKGEDHKQRKEEDHDSPIKEVKNFNKKYDADDFGNAKFTANSYITGLIVMIIVGGTVINALLSMSGKRRSSMRKREL
jgi:hypothetical protein